MYYYEYSNMQRITQTENGKKVVANFQKIYEEKYANEPISVLNYAYYKDFYLKGERTNYEKIYFNRRERLALLQVLAIANPDKYLETLEQILAVICDEFTWVVPAHSYNVHNDYVFDYTVIDLFSAETAMYLAETAYIFKGILSFDILDRIKISLENKIIKNYETHTFWFDSQTNNWASVCACGVGLTYLYQFPERFSKVKDRIFKTLNQYLESLDEEGYCNEGVSYWHYGFGFFCIFFDVYTGLTNENVEYLQSEKVKNTLHYFENARMSGDMFIPFADGGGRGEVKPNPYYFYAMKNLFKEELSLPVITFEDPNSSALGLRFLNGVDRFGWGEDIKPTAKTHYYKNSEVFIYKSTNYAFTAKSGNNGEIHNHNDIGSFEIIKDGKRYVIDSGCGEYTQNYFTKVDDSEDGRYGKKIFVCSSLAHSVPIVNNQAQKAGENYKGKVTKQDDREFCVELSKAYGLENQQVKVSYQMQEKSVLVIYEYAGVDEITFRFISLIKPRQVDNQILIDEMTVICSQDIIPSINKAEYKAYKGVPASVYTIDYALKAKSATIQFTFKFA